MRRSRPIGRASRSRPCVISVRIRGALRKVNRTGAPGSPAKRCAVNPAAFESPAFLAWVVDRVASGDRGFEPRQDRHARIAQRQSTRTTTWRGTFGSCCGNSAPVVKRTSRLTTNQETGGSSPSGSAQARLAKWESTWSTPRGRRSDSFAEHGGYSSIGRALGRDPGGCQFKPG